MEVQARIEELNAKIRGAHSPAENLVVQERLPLDGQPGASVEVVDPSELKDTQRSQENGKATVVEKSTGALLKIKHPNHEFFLCDLLDYAIKDDGASMEAPIYTLSTKPDLSVWNWTSKDGLRSITVTPSVRGRATVFDKDVLIYVVSQMTEGLNQGRRDVDNRTVRFRVYDYLVVTNKAIGGKEYQRLEDALERLRGTSITTNIKTGGHRIKEGFGIIDSWRIIEKSPNNERMVAVEVTLSKWLYNAVRAREVLTIDPDYFRLRKPIERRLYELARKHVGDQASFIIGIELLRDKCGSKATLSEFRRMLREIIEANTLPSYRLAIKEEQDQVVIYTRDVKKLARAVLPQAD